MDPLVNVVDDFDDAIFNDATDENELIDITDHVEYADDEDEDDLELVETSVVEQQPLEPPPQPISYEEAPTPASLPAAAATPLNRDDSQILMPPPPPPTKPRAKKEEPPILGSLMERTTRSATGSRGFKAKSLKLKLSDKAASKAPTQSFLGFYDRELDSDPEEEGSEMVFEEHFMLKMPPGEDCEKLRKMVTNRDVTNDVWFKFRDSRRAVFHIGNNTYSAKLVDLPSILESQKTWDNRHTFKVADISQMLVVQEKINPDEEPANKPFNTEEFIWPHGMTPPLHWARKRRFRKRVNRRTIETVEQEVERLLSEDALATEVQYDVLENVNPDLSDSEFMPRDDQGHPGDIGTPMFQDSEAGDAPTPATGYDGDMGDEDGDDSDSDGDEGEIDEELAAELNQALGSQSSEEDSEGEVERSEGEENEEEDEEEEFDNAEDKRAKKLLNEEIRDLEAAVEKKSSEIEKMFNPLIKRRFEDALRKLRTDLDLKILQRTQLMDLSQKRREAAAEDEEESEGERRDADGASHSKKASVAGVEGDGMDLVDDDDDLFGAPPPERLSDGGDEMDVG